MGCIGRIAGDGGVDLELGHFSHGVGVGQLTRRTHTVARDNLLVGGGDVLGLRRFVLKNGGSVLAVTARLG